MNAKYSLIKPPPSQQLCSRSVARRAERNPMNYAHHPTLPLESAMSCFFLILSESYLCIFNGALQRYQ